MTQKRALWCLIFAFCILNSQLLAAPAFPWEQQRVSLPSEGLIFQQFDTYPDKKGTWYGTNVSQLKFGPSPEASFRSTHGLSVRGFAEAQRITLRIPLNPDRQARRTSHLSAHRLRLMLRSSHRGAMRYRLITKDQQKLNSDWVRVRSTPSASRQARLSTDWITQAWCRHWQHIELPEINPLEPLYRDEQGKAAFAKAPYVPHELEIVLSDANWKIGEQHPFELHIDEVAIDVDYMLDYRKPWFKKSSVDNIHPHAQYPHPAFHFGMSEQWLLKPTQHEGAHLRWSSDDMPVITWGTQASKGPPQDLLWSYRPQQPLHIPSDRGVAGLRITLRSSGVSGQHLYLHFREEKIREATRHDPDGPEHESFSTRLPLDFRGRRAFEIPLSFLGLPLRDEFRKHNKKIDGHLAFLGFELRGSVSEESQSHELGILRIEQWVDGQHNTLWPSSANKEALPIASDFEVKNVGFTGLTLRDFEHPSSLNQAQFDDSTQTTQILIDERHATHGRYGVGLSLSPSGSAKELGCTLMFNLKKSSEHEPLKDHQSQLHIAATRRCEVQLIIKDDVGDNFISDPISIPRLTAKNFPKSTFLSNIKPIRFPVCDLKSKSWSYMGTGPKQNIKFPVRAAGLRFSTSSAKTIHLKFDQLTAHDVQLEQHLRYQRWVTASPVLKHQLTQESYDWKAFLPHDGWGVRSTHGYGIEHLLSTRTTKTPPQIISSLRSALIRAEERYLKNLKAWETLQRLDKKTNKTLDDFWKDADKRHQVGPEPKILDFISDQRGLRLHIQWPASQNLKPWERFGHSSILLEGYACSQPQLFLSEQTQALLCELKSSPLQGSSLCFAFESSLGATYLHNINLADGDVQNVILNVHHIRSKLRKQHKKDEAFHIRLKMVSIELLHSKHHQEAEQHLHIRPLKAIFKK